MIEGIISVLGLCITFCPPVIYLNYLLTHIVKKTRFDYHLSLVSEHHKYGIYLSYIERILFGTLICTFGILMSEFFRNETIFKIFIIVLITYIIVKYFDERNEK